MIPVKANKDFQLAMMNEQESQDFLNRIQEISEKFSHLDKPVFDEMDALWIKCKKHSLKNMKFSMIIKNVPHMRLKHMKMIIPFMKAKFKE